MSLQIPLVEVDRDKQQANIARASNILYQVAKAAYGPGGGNVMLGFKHGAPMLSRDGVTNMSQVRLNEPFEDDVIQTLLQSSKKNNTKVGDGTTAVVILSHHLLMAAQKMEGKGFKPMEIARKLKEAEKVAIEYIDSIKTPISDDKMLEYVATVAAGDPEIGAMICDVMKDVGIDGGVQIEQYEGLGIHPEIIDGFYFHKGYTDTQLINDPATNQSNHKDVAILVSSKVFNTEPDIKPLLNEVVKAGFKELILIAEVKNLALEVLKLAKASGAMMVVPIDPPFNAGGQSLFLDDIAVMIGSEIYNGQKFDPAKHLGSAKEVLVTEWATSILGGDGDKDVIDDRIMSLKEQLGELEHPGSIQFVKDRLARLTGKMAILKVGGAIEFERDELKERIRDAVCAVQSSMKDGIVPGGGTVLARVSGTEFDDAFKQPFRQLVENIGENPDKYLAMIETTQAPYGFNLRNLTPKPIDLIEEGVLDASLVVREVVINSVAVVAGLITASAAVAFQEKQ
jgi:chaperonin GroEL